MTLEVALDRPLPPSLPIGTATAVFCIGSCLDRDSPVRRLEIVVDGVAHPASAFNMPRPDLGHSAGFWATVPLPARTSAGEITIEVWATLADGGVASAELGRVAVKPATRGEPAQAVPAAATGDELIAVCMATFDPDLGLLAAQLDSLRAQTDDRWVCVISDDCSDPASFEQIAALVGDDPRFALSRSAHRLGFYRNFERALSIAPADAALIALCDQDDRWHVDKLRTLREAIGAATLVYSDMRLVRADGTVLRDTMWRGRANNHDNLTSMLIANTITGAATLFRRELLPLLLPFPDTPGMQFHDTWLAVTALSAGDVAYVEHPLYDYVQHPAAVFGDVTHGDRPRGRGHPVEAWRASYFHGYLSREVQAQVLLARCATLTPTKRRALERFIDCDRSPLALAVLATRPVRALSGRTETLGSELDLARGAAWKQLACALARRPTNLGGVFADARVPPPDRFTQKRLRRWRASI